MSTARSDIGAPEALLPAGAQGAASGARTAMLLRLLDERREKPRAKEQEVLDVATEYFLKHGYQGASINAMARSSGISKESIYRYFSSKKQLFEAVIVRELGEYRQLLTRLGTSLQTMEFREALVTIAETVLGAVNTDRTLALRRLIFEEARNSPDVGQHYYQIGPEHAYVLLENLFTQHRADSLFDAAIMSRHFIALIAYRIIIERECAVRPVLSKPQVREWAENSVDEFMKAFVRTR
ncbi:MAG TPA: TetR/AcrR family transcriptional regulator [Gammaproteobacteria bacterium]|nr:TetR/AcrR family transcriptional regulator [Gammaproteobacteria bacterium]